MNNRTLAEHLSKEAIKFGADQVQVQIHSEDSSLTRFAASQIHQNVYRSMGGINVMAVKARSIGIARINALTEEAGSRAVKQALATASLVPPNKNFVSLPEPIPWTPIFGSVNKATAECSPEERAKVVKEIIDAAHGVSDEVTTVSGSVSTGMYRYAVANSLGVSAEAEYTLAATSVTVISGPQESLSYSVDGEVSRSIRDLKTVETGVNVAENSVHGLNPIMLEPGVYEAILKPNAGIVALGSVTNGFAARAWRTGTSFVRQHDGERIFDPKLSIIDDPRHPETVLTVPVDGEGVPKERVELITEGRIGESSICYDSMEAHRIGKKSTGHSALPGGRSFGPALGNLIVKAGSSSLEEMIEETKRGVLVTQFNYNSLVDAGEVIISGLTRNGTFLIEEGEIKAPIMNLRYTDSMLNTLKDIPLISKQRTKTRTKTLPIIKVNELRFTGSTQY